MTKKTIHVLEGTLSFDRGQVSIDEWELTDELATALKMERTEHGAPRGQRHVRITIETLD